MMKTFKFFFPLVLGILILSAGCDKEEDTKNKTVYPLTPSESIKTFFDESWTNGNCFTRLDNDTLHVINDKAQFRAMYQCSNELPDINFDKYTLVLGSKVLFSLYDYAVEEQYIVMGDTPTLYLRVREPVNGSWTSLGTLYYWAIYPKINSKKITVFSLNQK